MAELPGKTDYDFYPVELAEKYRADDRRIIENGASETFEERFLTKGVERFAQTTKVPLRDDQGRIYGTLGIAEDITERKQAEEALHKSEETHKNMIANISDVIGIIGVDGIMKYKSPNIEKWFGWQPQDLIGTDGWLAVHPDDLKRIQKEFLTLLEKDNSTTTLKYRYKCKEGSYKWIELTAVNLIHDPMINGVLMNYHDITDRKQVEEALRESDARLELFFTQSLDGFFFMMLDKPIQWDDSIDKDQALDYAFAHQRITKVNDALLAQYGATREQYLGLTPNTLFAHDIEYGKRVWSKFFDEGHLHIDTDERKLDDTPIWIEGDYICLYDSEGRITGHFGIQRDISERKQAEDELRHTKEVLTTVNIELQAALNREKDLARTDVLTGINNRRHLFELAEREFDVATRYQQPLSVLIFDLDHFKQVNDTFGHAVGDQMLQRVTEVACAELRSADVIGRYGGEEFVILLPMTTAQDALPLAERIRVGVAAIRIPTKKGDASATISIGIAELKHTSGESLDSILICADKAMYAAKQAGRNCTVISEQ